MPASNVMVETTVSENELESAMGGLRSMLGESFTSDMAVVAFERIAREYYVRNFGTMSKQGIDVLLFDIFRKALYEGYKSADGSKGFVNSRDYSDYSISRRLGITEARVRNIKEKALIVYGDVEGDDNWWHKPLLSYLAKAKPEGAGKYKFRVIDKSVRDELENYLDNETAEQGSFIEYSLNPKVVTVNEEVLVALVAQLWPTAFVNAQSSDFFAVMGKFAQNRDEYNKLESAEQGEINEVLKTMQQQRTLRARAEAVGHLTDIAKSVLSSAVTGVLNTAL